MGFDLKRALAGDEGKAITGLPAHPALMDSSVPMSVYSPGAARQDAQISQREAPAHAQAYGGKNAIDWVYDCVNLYADTTSSAGWHLERDGAPLVRKQTDGTPPDAKVGPAGLYDLLDQPNPYMLYSEMVSLLVIDLLLVGNAYWMKWRTNEQGQPLALYRLSPGHVKIIPDTFGPKGYEYQPPGAKDPLKLSPQDVMHFRRPNPHSHYYGLGLIKGGGRSYDMSLAVTDTISSYYENRADPSMIVQSERRVPRDVFNKLRAQLRSRLAGSSRAGELLVLEAGLKASTLTPSARDALLAEVARMDRDRVFAHFRANPKLFGIVDETGGSDKVTDARREFDTYVIRPFMDRLENLVSTGLAAAWGVDFKIDYSYNLPLEELLKNAGSVATIPGIKVREIRRFLKPLGIAESTGDKELDEMVLNVPGEELDENGQGGFADQPLTGEAGRPPKVRNTVAFGSTAPAGKALDLTERLRLIEDRAFIEGKASQPLRGEVAPPDPFERDREAAVNSAAAFIQQHLQEAVTVLERDLLDIVEGKAFKPNNIRSRMRNAPAWKTFAQMVEDTLIEGSKRAISASAMTSTNAPDDLDYDAIAKSVALRPQGSRSIVKTLKTRILNNVGLTLEKTEPLQAEVLASVQGAIRDWRTGTTETIGVTEAVEAYNEGTLSVLEATDATEVYVTDGDDHDDECAEANGQIWSIEDARAKRTAHPNCRRAFLPLGEVS